MLDVYNQYNDKKYNGILITFGCSWTFGTGLNYKKGLPRDVFNENVLNQKLADTFSFRALLSKKFNLYNINYGEGASSNERQFRYARELFSDHKLLNFLQSVENVVVLWGITSTARNEQWNNEIQGYDNFMYNSLPSLFHKIFVKKTYDHKIKIKELAERMRIWNGFFLQYKINNLWFDTFNTHQYPIKTNNIINSDIMTLMNANKDTKQNTINTYHKSAWNNDDTRLKPLIDLELLNPYSFHPTKLGHEKIAEIIEPYLRNMI